ncbi:MAG TPA: four helix bundle protein [Blastocatellia bacterium]|jgi:four helix bundle protein
MTVKSFRDLRVWQAAMDLVEKIYRLTQKFPAQEAYGLTNQLRRAAVSIPSNIAEGHARQHTKEYLNFLSVTQGSLAELQTQIEIAGRLGYLPKSSADEVVDDSISLSKQLYALRNAIAKRG